METKLGKIIRIAGPLVEATGLGGSALYDIVLVGKEGLKGEIIEILDNVYRIQVYEETGGLKVGEKITPTYEPLSVLLGPGVLKSIYDGIQRPLEKISQVSGTYISRGINVPSLDLEKMWDFEPTVKVGDKVSAGDVLGTVQETELIVNKIMVPVKIKAGKITKIEKGQFNVTQDIAVIEDAQGKEHKVQMAHKWPIRKPRIFKNKIYPRKPLITGQRVIDMYFPIMKGGTAVIPGPFGSGKTFVQHHISKYSDAQIIVYVGCGERGNEMTDVLNEFPHLIDPTTGKTIMEKTVLIANTSNMPIAAREASVYTGMALAEYYRDMGYDVTMLADSTSRWAEAMREMSGRLEEMPGEAGYPAYLNSRIAAFYERAGITESLGKEPRLGSVTAVGAISPPGGDLSEPVSQASLGLSKVFLSLNADLAYARHYPSIHWLQSYSLYNEDVDKYCDANIASDFSQLRVQSMQILKEEESLIELARIVGLESLSVNDRVLLNTAKSLREDFLQQNAFVDIDRYTNFEMQYHILKLIMTFHENSLKLVKENEDVNLEALFESDLMEKVARAKTTPEENKEELINLIKNMREEIYNIPDLGLVPSTRANAVDTVNNLEQ